MLANLLSQIDAKSLYLGKQIQIEMSWCKLLSWPELSMTVSSTLSS